MKRFDFYFGKQIVEANENGNWVEYDDAKEEIRKAVAREREEIAQMLEEDGRSNSAQLVSARGRGKSCDCGRDVDEKGNQIHYAPCWKAPALGHKKPGKIARFDERGWSDISTLEAKLNELIDRENARGH
jgi:hypothetical protein